MKPWLIISALFFSECALAQVDQIKQASESNSASASKGNYSDEEGGGSFFILDVLFNVLPQWQAFKLQEGRARYPSMVSFEVLLQGGIKPSAYYLLWPRVRGNWGLFSTDFRLNYLIEEDIDGGFKHMRTNDWQIIQFNLITSRFITMRIGTGFMQEAFGRGESFNEWSFILGFHSPDQFRQIFFEYRFAKDWDTGANPRREASAQYQQKVFSAGVLHGYFSAGLVYQRYYSKIEVWGIQGGFIFRVF